MTVGQYSLYAVGCVCVRHKEYHFNFRLIQFPLTAVVLVCVKGLNSFTTPLLPAGEHARVSLLGDRGGTVTGLGGVSLGTGDHGDRFSPTHNSYL